MAAQLRHSVFLPTPFVPRLPSHLRRLPRSSTPNFSAPLSTDLGSGSGSGSNGGPKKPTGGSGGGSNDDHSNPKNPFDFLLSGWRSRVAADAQFPFKVLMEQLVGVTACVLGDMSSRPNFGLNELDFVFSTLVVGSILNFVLMYLLAPTLASSSASSDLPSYMFAPGAYPFLARLSTCVYKGVTFAAVGFAAGLAGTAISNGLMAVRKKMDPGFETPNEPPPTLLNAATWAAHMGVSSNLRYQTLNGVEHVLEKALPGAGFKTSVVVLRVLNNVLGGVSFVALARLTGSQKTAAKGEDNEKLIGGETAMTMVAETGDGELRKDETDNK